MNKDLQARAAKCDLGVRQRTTDDGLWEWPGSNALHESPPDYDDWNNVIRLRDLAIEKNLILYSVILKTTTGAILVSANAQEAFAMECATKEQILEAAVRTLEETT